MSKVLPTEFVIDDGVKEYTIKNTLGEIVSVFRINPSDTKIVHKFKEAIEYLDGYEYNPGTTEDEAVQAVIDMDNAIEEQIVKLFNKDFADCLFERYKPCTLLENGDFYIEKSLAILGSILENETGERIEKKKARIKRDLAKRK